MPATSRSVVLVGVAAATATLLFYILQAAEHPDRVRTQSINYKVSYFTWQTESGLNLHSPSVTALALLSFVAWTPSSKVKATLALILSLAVSVGLDVVFMLYAAHHLIHSTNLFSLASLALAAPALTWAAFFWLVTSQGEELYEKAAWAIPELVRIYNSRPRLPVGPLAFP